MPIKEAKRTGGPCDAEYACWPKFTLEEVAKHATLNDGWIVVFDRVFDITMFAVTHPGFHNAGEWSDVNRRRAGSYGIVERGDECIPSTVARVTSLARP